MTTKPALISLVFAVTAVTGCATSPPPAQPFHEFLAATTQVAESADDALTAESTRYRSRFEDSVIAGDKAALAKLFLSPAADDPYRASYAEDPIFETINKQQKKLGELNSLVTQYAELLVRIVGQSGEYDTEARATALNEDIDKLYTGLQSIREPGTDAAVSESQAKAGALVSTAFATAAKAYIENKRREDLVELLEQGQPIINEYANQGASIAKTAASTLWRDYGDRWIAVREPTADGIRKLLALNQSHLDQLDALKELDRTFSALGASHAELITATREGADISFRSLIERVKELKALYSKLKDSGANAGS